MSCLVERTLYDKKLKEVRSAKKSVESAIRLFGPANVTSILDRETFNERLTAITTKLETYIEKAEEANEELQELRHRDAETETECSRRIDEINTITDAIIKKVNDNEHEVKKKMEKVIREFENRDVEPDASQSNSTTIFDSSQLPTNQLSKTEITDNLQDHLILSDKIAEYCENGPFLTHLPQFIYAVKYVISQYQKKLPIFGHLLKPVIVGGAVDSTAGSLTAPDLDFNIEWDLDEGLIRHLLIRPTDEGESGQYTLQVLKGHEDKFKSKFRRFIIDIQNHGRPDMAGYVHNKVNYAYVEKDCKTFVSSDLLRSQVGGLFELLKDGKSFGDFTPKDFSQTGAARTMALDVKKFFRECLITCLMEIPDNYKPIFNRFVDESCYKILPELEVDYTPVLTIPYEQLPADLKLWEEKDSWLLDEETKKKIKEAKGTLVAKSLEKDESRSSIIWRLSLNSAPVMQKVINHFQHLEPKCSVKKILRLIKDIKNVALDGNEKDFLKSYNVKQAMLWCMDENPNISTEADLLMSTLRKIIQFYQQKTLPSFLEAKRTLIFKMSKSRQLKVAENRVMDILNNVDIYLEKIKDVQAKNRKGVSEVRNILAPMAPILLFPVVSNRISEKTTLGVNKDFRNKEGMLLFYFEDTENVEIFDKVTKRNKTVSEREALKFVIKNWIDSVLIYVTKTEDDNEKVIDDDAAQEEMPCGNVAAIDLVHSIASALPANQQSSKQINQVAALLVPAIADSIPEANDVLPNVTNIVNTVRDIRNLFSSFR